MAAVMPRSTWVRQLDSHILCCCSVLPTGVGREFPWDVKQKWGLCCCSLEGQRHGSLVSWGQLTE